VKYFRSFVKKVNYFPRGLTKFFKNLEIVYIYNGNLQEVSKNDLKEFGENLKKLLLDHNEIRVIEGDLFEFSPNLNDIDLRSNKIVHIDLEAFDKLDELKSLHMEKNSCTSDDKKVVYGRSEVLELIRDVEKSCKNPNLAVNADQIFKAMKTMQEENLKNFEKLFSKISNLETDIENQKSTIATMTTKLSTIEEKISTLDLKPNSTVLQAPKCENSPPFSPNNLKTFIEAENSKNLNETFKVLSSLRQKISDISSEILRNTLNMFEGQKSFITQQKLETKSGFDKMENKLRNFESNVGTLTSILSEKIDNYCKKKEITSAN
jgi:hypothetical protein